MALTAPIAASMSALLGGAALATSAGSSAAPGSAELPQQALITLDGANFLASYPMDEPDRSKVGYQNALRLFGDRIPNIGG